MEDLPDDYLGSEFAWAMILDLPDMTYYLNYPGSKLWPLTKVRVHLRSYRQEKIRTPPTNTFYEELWYHRQSPIGLRRYNQITVAPLSDGAVIVCPADDTSDLLQRPPAIADAIVRLLVDMQFRKAVIGLVLVHEDEYDDIAKALSQYRFFAQSGNLPIRPLSIHLRAYPKGKDQVFYLQNGF